MTNYGTRLFSVMSPAHQSSANRQGIRLRPFGLDGLGTAIFWIFVAVLITRAITTADTAWDTLNYHLPFAARRIGLISKDEYTFKPWLELCYNGIPALPYYLYGLLWRIFGNSNAATIVSPLAFAGYCLFIARLLGAPLLIVATATAAIPAIYVNLTSAYTDLVVNLAFGGALLLITTIVMEPAGPLLPRVLSALALAAIAGNYKIQFIPLIGLFVPLFALALLLARPDRESLLVALYAELKNAGLGTKLAFIAVVVLCYASALKNLYFHQNPIFPVGVTIFGQELLPGVSGSDLYADPAYLRDTAQPIRWALSVLDFLSLGLRPIPYTIGQGDVPPDAQSLRMGGYMGVFVVYNALFFVRAALHRGRSHMAILAAFAALTVAVACLPASHELRYYSFWMVYLVGLNIAYCWRWGEEVADRQNFCLVAVSAFIFLTSVTGLQYIVPRPSTIEATMPGPKLDQIYVPHLQDGKRYCLLNWGAYPMLGTPLFHREHKFSVVEGEDVCPLGTIVMDLQKLQSSSTNR